MPMFRLPTGLAAALLLAALPAAAQNQPGGAVTLRTVKYAGLAEEVVKNRGKVVVVDLWGFF
jgi:hypothetical protein